jgi:hypothetical protein
MKHYLNDAKSKKTTPSISSDTGITVPPVLKGEFNGNKVRRENFIEE